MTDEIKSWTKGMVVSLLLLGSAAAHADAQWWVCGAKFDGKTYRARYCTAETDDLAVDLRFCLYEVGDSGVPRKGRPKKKHVCSERANDGAKPMCRRTHESCVE